MKIIPAFLGEALRRWLLPDRAPDLQIGGEDRPYMNRWYVIPRNRVFNIYLHQILRDDDDRALHDHPWVNVSLILAGGYVEVLPRKDGRLVRHYRSPGSLLFRRPRAAHRLELPPAQFGDLPRAQSWSLFITGPRVREWGFWCRRGWVHWCDFTSGPRGELVGPGCDAEPAPREGRR